MMVGIDWGCEVLVYLIIMLVFDKIYYENINGVRG